MHSAHDSKSSVDLKHESMQNDDKDAVIHIDTKHSEHYRSLHNFIDNLEAKSLIDIKHFINLLESTSLKHLPIESILKCSSHLLQLKEEKIAHDNHFKLLQIKNARIRTEIVTALRFQKKELNESILLIRKMIALQKRNKRLRTTLPIIIPMIGAAIFMTYKYFLFKNNHVKRYYSLENELNQLMDITERRYDTYINPNNINVACTKTNDKNPESFAYCIYKSKFFESLFKDRCKSPYMPILGIYKKCRHPILRSWCINFDRITSIKLTLSNSFFDIMDIISGNINLHLICLLFEEYAPYIMAIIMPFILLSIVINERIDKYIDNHDSISERDRDNNATIQDIQILNIAFKHDVIWFGYSDSRLLRDLEHKSKEITAHLDPFDKAENMRMAFLSGMNEKNTKKSPIRKLFHNEYKDHQNGCEPKIVTKIFAFAGISINKLNKDYKKAERTTFESGAHPKHNITLIYANNVEIPHPLFGFFSRLNTELVRRPPVRRRNPHQLLLFQKLTTLKKFTEQGGKAYDKRKILRNIYEFAGLIPTKAAVPAAT